MHKKIVSRDTISMSLTEHTCLFPDVLQCSDSSCAFFPTMEFYSMRTRVGHECVEAREDYGTMTRSPPVTTYPTRAVSIAHSPPTVLQYAVVFHWCSTHLPLLPYNQAIEHPVRCFSIAIALQTRVFL